jgi:alpha-glucosidase
MMKGLLMNKKLALGVVLLGVLSSGPVFGEGFYLVFSPDGTIKAQVTVNDSVTYSVSCDDKAIIVDSPLSLKFEDGALPGKSPTVRSHRRGTINERWKSIYGQRSEIADKCNELQVALHESASGARRLQLVVRAYNDGVAFRYYLPKQPEPDKFVLTKEDSQFRFAKDHTVWAADYKKFVSHQEEEWGPAARAG